MKKHMRIFWTSILFFTLGFALLAGSFYVITPKQAEASITVSPLRVVFEGRTRSADIMLLNLSGEENTYRVGWVYNRQKEDGQYDRMESPLNPEHNPADYIVFSPRQVTIPPSGRQKVRLSLRRPADLPDGEYRAHMIFQKLPGEGTDPSLGAQEEGMSLSMIVTLGFSIPVIVRQGDYDAQITMSSPRFLTAQQANRDDGDPRLEVTLNRTGKHSTLGRMIVTWDQSDKPNKRVGLLNNVSIFPEIDKRIVRIRLTEKSIPSGNLTVSYVGEGPQRGVIFSETTIPVGQ